MLEGYHQDPIDLPGKMVIRITTETATIVLTGNDYRPINSLLPDQKDKARQDDPQT